MNWLLPLLLLLGSSVPSYRGVRECATCHPAQARPQPETSMAHALETVAECRILREHPFLTFADGKFRYRIERKGDGSIYSVTDGQETITAPVLWAFGLGSAGQTYVFEHGGELFQSRVSYYASIGALDLTIGARNLAPQSLLQAAGQVMDGGEKLRCFGCHSTNSAAGRTLTLDKLTPGVQCERCHGSSEAHLGGVKRGEPKAAFVMQPLGKLSTEELLNFCGQCHRTWEEIASSGTLGVSNVRFQPYRLTNSKCYDSEDARISCIACHDPHQEINREDASYDAKCKACHAGGKPAAKACPTAKSGCTSCHMPKIEIPGSHHGFTDHQIRIVRANAPYPN
jgi:Cytochrome c554 and c-prime